MKAARPTAAAGPLEKLGTALGKNGPKWARYEERDEISVQATGIEEKFLKSLTMEALKPLASAYGGGLTCSFSAAGEPGLEVNEGLTEEKIDRFVQKMSGIGEFRLDFRLDKKALIEDWFGPGAGEAERHLYLFEEALERDLLKPIGSLEELFWPEDAKRKAMVLVPDVEIELDGGLFSVLGGNGLAKWAEYANPAEKTPALDFGKINQEAQDTLRWQQPWVKRMTPAHLWVNGKASEDNRLARAIQSQFVNLFMLYSADRSVEHDGVFVSTYSGAKFTAEIRWGPHKEQAFFSWEDIKSLGQTFLWAYEPTYKASDRLPLVQIDVAKTVRVMEQAQGFDLLVKSAHSIFGDLDEQWIEVIENRIDAFSERKDKLGEQVAKAVNEFSGQVSEIIDSVSNAALGLVGVLIGTFIAALFKEDFNGTIFRAGLLIYAGYVLLFPLAYNMSHQWFKFRAQEALFERNKETFAKQLEESTVRQIVGEEVANTIRSFKRWFGLTTILYVVMIVLLVTAAQVGEGWVRAGAGTATATAAPTSQAGP